MTNQANPYEDMPVYDAHIPAELFSEFIARMPQVCVDLILKTADGILLAKRENTPRIWFWPGSRLYKGEALEDAAHRIAREELGIDVCIQEQLGPYAHFWEESAVAGSPTRHTVNPTFHVTPANEEYEITLDEQHSQYRFLTTIESDVHEYVRRPLRDTDLL